MDANKSELISIIVPVYNAENYIKKCLDSLLAQDYSNIEIIVVDDGSTDKTPDICNQYAQNDKRIVYCQKSNQGVSAARNTGLQMAKGDYIGFVDADDYVDSDMYSSLLDAIKLYNVPVAYCGFYSVKSENNVDTVFEHSDFKNRLVSNREVLSDILLNNHCTSVWNKLIRADYAKHIFPMITMGEDACYLVDLFTKEEFNCAELSKCCYYYVQHQGSARIHSFSDKHLDSIKCVDYIIDRVKSKFGDKFDKQAEVFIFTYMIGILARVFVWDVEKQYSDVVSTVALRIKSLKSVCFNKKIPLSKRLAWAMFNVSKKGFKIFMKKYYFNKLYNV